MITKLDLAVRRNLGRKIRALRHRQGWSQNELSSLCGISGHHLGKIERGAANATLATLVAIAKALKVSVSRLFAEVS